MKKIVSIKQICIGVLLVISLFLACKPTMTSISADNTDAVLTQVPLLQKIRASETLRVGTTGDFSPFSYVTDEEPQSYRGIDIELAKDLAKSLGVSLKFVPTSWPTLLEDLKADKFDIGMSGITIKLSRQQEALFSIPLLASGKAAITRDENVTFYSDIDLINRPNVRVIFNNGGTNEAFARENFPKAILIENEDNLSIFQKLVNGEADVMVTDAIETLVQEMIHPELESVNGDKPFNFFEMAYLLPVDHTFKAYVDQWLHLRQKDGTYQRIFDNELFAIKSRAAVAE